VSWMRQGFARSDVLCIGSCSVGTDSERQRTGKGRDRRCPGFEPLSRSKSPIPRKEPLWLEGLDDSPGWDGAGRLPVSGAFVLARTRVHSELQGQDPQEDEEGEGDQDFHGTSVFIPLDKSNSL
jgi:hypothetical protein